MAKRENKYKLLLEQVELANGEAGNREPIEIEFTNHDEVFGIIDRLRQKNPFGDTEKAAQFALGLKLFSEVMIKNRSHPLFEDLLPPFGEFMKKLKAS